MAITNNLSYYTTVLFVTLTFPGTKCIAPATIGHATYLALTKATIFHNFEQG
jgi:hypothetical protein